MIERFKQYGLNLNQLKEISSNKLQGKRFVFTGSLVQYSRQQAQAAVEAAGGSFSSSVSKKTDFVVAGKDAGSKLDKAKELGVEIIDEDQFRKILKE
jgi:DNA ligase (NAD+)